MAKLQTLAYFAALVLPFAGPAAAQEFPFRIRGDTAGTPRGCSARVAIHVINDWFMAFNSADSAKLDRATATRFGFTSGAFSRAHPFVSAHDIATLVRYSRSRAAKHERLSVQEVTFNHWRGRALKVGPIYFLRSADDLGREPLPGIGKGEVVCGEGMHILNVAPRPAYDPGPKQ